MAGARAAEQAILSLCKEFPTGLHSHDLETSLQHIAISDRATAINNLLQQHRLQISKDHSVKDGLVYKEVDEGEALKYKNFSTEEMLVYQHIQQTGNIGIWTKDLKMKTNLQQPQITKILKNLESRQLIKAVKSVSNARKVYMLYELEPARELTGGAWYTENEFDSEFFQVLQEACYRFILRQSDATLEEVAEFIWDKGLSRTDLRDEDVCMLIDTLEYDGKIASVTLDDVEHYRPALLDIPETSALTSVPCGVCPVFNQCHEGGPISPATCVYYTQWFDF